MGWKDAPEVPIDQAGNTGPAWASAPEVSASGGGSSPANAGMVNFAATTLGVPVDTAQNIINLGIAAYGRLTNKGGDAPEPLSGSVGTSEWIKQKLRQTGMAGLSPDNPTPTSGVGTTAYDLASRGGFIPGGALPAIGSMVAEKIGGPEWASVGALAPAAIGAAATAAGVPSGQDAARWLMQKSLKPSLADLKTGKAAKAIDTMLQEGFNPTMGGVQKMRDQISELNDQITQAIANSPATVNKVEIGRELKPLLQRMKNQVTPQADIAAVQKTWQEFIDHPLLQGTNQIPVQTAQSLKQGTYQALGNKNYGELKGAETEAQKTLARALKEKIAEAVPAVAPLNARESNLLNAMRIAEHRALLEGNRNPGGLAWLTHSPFNWAAYMADKSALAKALAARGIYNASELTNMQGTSPVLSSGVLAGILAQQQGK